jgi:hypothetical protein
MPHPTLTDIRAALTCLAWDATVSEIGAYDDGTIEIYTTDEDAPMEGPLLISRRRIDGQRWHVTTTRPSIDGWEPPTRRAHDIAERLSTIEDRGYGHIRAARVATDEAGVWRVWAPVAGGYHALTDI